MGQHQFARCWTDDGAIYSDSSFLDSAKDQSSLLRQFQLCKKGEIQDQKIEIEMFV